MAGNNLKDNQKDSDNSLHSDVPGGNDKNEIKSNNISGPKADDEEDKKGEKKEILDIEPCKVDKKKSPDQNDPVSLPKSSVGDREPTEKSSPSLDRKRPQPEDALNEIKTQGTHCLYCSYCKSNITTDAELFPKGKETDEYKTKPFVLWIPLLIPSFLHPLFRRSNRPVPIKPIHGPVNPITSTSIPEEPLITPPNPVKPTPDISIPEDPLKTPTDPVNPIPPKGLWKKLKKVFRNWLTFLLILLVVVLLLISVIVLRVAQKKHVDKDSFPPTPMYFKYLPVIALLVLAILAVPWRSIPVSLPKILHHYIVVPVQNLDILKSIVYGGLIESITSLGVVSCAAGSGTSTLNVLALAIANLFTGLILIIQKLHLLITNKPRSHNANNDIVTISDKEDLYKEMLGNKDKCKLHCVVVVVSFIFFGLIPPLFYGLSLKKTDEGLYKVGIVLSASLVCVISLSFAKKYAFKLRERWIVPVYTGMAVVASVLSFIGSQFLSNLLEKYDFRELASDYSKR